PSRGLGDVYNRHLVLVLALICSVLPTNFIVFVSEAVTLGHLYKFSMECALVVFVVFFLLFILYFRFSSKDTIAILLTPLCFILKIPYAMPLAMGLVGTPFSAVSVASGAIVYYTVSYMTSSASVLNTFEEDGTLEKFRYVIDGMMGNKSMYVTLAAFVATVIIVYFIRRLSVDYAWTIAMITGALLDVMILLFGDLMYNTNLSIGGLIIGSVVSVVLVKILEFFVFNVDYSRTEYVQFEDDEYYYYVKAVPKNTVAAPQKRVKTIRVPEKAVREQKRDR
nr:hypothetical protein [Lachnospiraceae bacterium]